MQKALLSVYAVNPIILKHQNGMSTMNNKVSLSKSEGHRGVPDCKTVQRCVLLPQTHNMWQLPTKPKEKYVSI